MSTQLHLHLHPGFTGRVELPDGDTVTVYGVDGGSAGVAVAPPAVPAIDPEVAARLDDFARLNRHIHELHAGMVEQGWTFYPPKSRTPGKQPTREDLRAVYEGRQHRMSLLVNSRTLCVYAVDVVDYAATLPGADQRENGNVYFVYTGPDGARPGLDVTAALARRADGTQIEA